MDSQPYFEQFSGWLTQAKALASLCEAQSRDFSSEDIFRMRADLVIRAQDLLCQFDQAVSHEISSIREFRASSHNIGRLAQPDFGDKAEKARELAEEVRDRVTYINGEIEPDLLRVRQKIQQALSARV